LHSDIADNPAMPWKATDAMKERVKFVLEWEERWNEAQGGPTDMAELCRKYGVSRTAGHGWVKRFRAANHDVRAVEERARRPHTNPKAMVDRYPEVEWPSISSAGNILKRRGLSRPKRKRLRAPPATEPFANAVAPNDTWCIDFKGRRLPRRVQAACRDCRCGG
jgi:putative transposase